MNLSTNYLGMRLPHPLIPGASPMTFDLDMVRRLEDAGAAAIVMHSLFEEQLAGEHAGGHPRNRQTESNGAALNFFRGRPNFRLDPDEHLEQLNRIKSAVGVPVIASLNGSTPGGWLRFAKSLQQTGVDALELNVYELATDLQQDGRAVEQRILQTVRSVQREVTIPVAVKLSPFYSSLAHFAMQLDLVGAEGLILFNRFYQPDIDVEGLDVIRTLRLSQSDELLLRLRWLAILSGTIDASLIVSGGIHTGLDAVKALMCGAHAVQMVSALLRHGPERLAVVRRELAEWLERHEYESLELMQGCMSLRRCPKPGAYERAAYLQILQEWES